MVRAVLMGHFGCDEASAQKPVLSSSRILSIGKDLEIRLLLVPVAILMISATSQAFGQFRIANQTLQQAGRAGVATPTNQPEPGSPALTPFGNMPGNFVDAFKGDNIYLHLAAITSTCILVTGGVDYRVEHFFNTNPKDGQFGRGVFITGQLLPFVAGGSLLLYGGIARDKEILGASYAVIQASVMELLYNTALKAVTGRPGPDWRHHSDMDSLSRVFRFGILRGGVFWGWPSGHTAATMAVVSALTSYYPNSLELKIAGYGLVAYTIYAVSSVNRGGMHWFSDAVAAALMSYAIGSTVGKYYRDTYSRISTAGPTQQALAYIAPVTSPLLTLSLTF